jgi:hypothetical protein
VILNHHTTITHGSHGPIPKLIYPTMEKMKMEGKRKKEREDERKLFVYISKMFRSWGCCC